MFHRVCGCSFLLLALGHRIRACVLPFATHPLDRVMFTEPEHVSVSNSITLDHVLGSCTSLFFSHPPQGLESVCPCHCPYAIDCILTEPLGPNSVSLHISLFTSYPLEQTVLLMPVGCRLHHQMFHGFALVHVLYSSPRVNLHSFFFCICPLCSLMYSFVLHHGPAKIYSLFQYTQAGQRNDQ